VKRLGLILALVMVAAACGDGASLLGPDSSTTEVSASVTTATTISTSTTTTAAVPTTAASTTSTQATTTTGTTPPKPFQFRPDGLGVVSFGQIPKKVIAEMTAIFGPPTSDTGWVDEPLCAGPLNRFVEFGVEKFDLQLIFTDGDLFADNPHFYSYRYNGVTPVPVSPPELTVGTTLAELLALYPGAQIMESPWVIDEYVFQYIAAENEWLYGNLSGNAPTDTVTSLEGGIGCAE